MSTPNPNPLIPQGSLQQASAKSKSNLRVAFFIVAVVHVALIGGILAVGCKKEEPKVDPGAQQQVTSTLPPLSPEYYPPTTPSTLPPASATPTPMDPLGGALPPLPPIGGTPSNGTAAASSLPPIPGPETMLPPEPAPMTEPAPAAPGSEYTIARGDTFYDIGRKLKVSTKALVAANPGLDPTRLQVGQVIKVPAGASMTSSGGSAASTASPAASSSASYTVKSGDNLTRIASKHGTTVAALKRANNLRTDRINVGQKLKVPGAPAPAPAPVPAAIPEGLPGLPPAGTDPLGGGALPPLPGNP